MTVEKYCMLAMVDCKTLQCSGTLALTSETVDGILNYLHLKMAVVITLLHCVLVFMLNKP